MLDRNEDTRPTDHEAIAQDFASPSVTAEEKGEAMSPDNAQKRKWGTMFVMALVPALMLAAGGYFWFTSGRYVSTDNAYVQQNKVSIASEIGGKIVEVAVQENQLVNKGDLLFRIDPEPYELAVKQANADIAAAQANVSALNSDYAATSVDISAAHESIEYAKIDLERQQSLMERGFTTRARLQEAERGVQVAQDRLHSARAAASRSRAKLATGAAVPGVNPAIAAATADRQAAQLNLSRTSVFAPYAGRVVQADRLQTGQHMVAGLPALTLVADSQSWIEANFKETDLANMSVGQPAEIHFDAYPDMVLKGVVASIGAGTGSEFSVLPAQNATGNWVKVTQRVPVRIRITQKPSRQLIAGLSADVTIDTKSQQR